jgi:hypothetical protein
VNKTEAEAAGELFYAWKYAEVIDTVWATDEVPSPGSQFVAGLSAVRLNRVAEGIRWVSYALLARDWDENVEICMVVDAGRALLAQHALPEVCLVLSHGRLRYPHDPLIAELLAHWHGACGHMDVAQAVAAETERRYAHDKLLQGMLDCVLIR